VSRCSAHTPYARGKVDVLARLDESKLDLTNKRVK
jgi:hypothetical protein